jgi:hypothetical protein
MSLQLTKGITNGLKQVFFFFSAHGLSIKLSVNLLTTDLPTDQKLHTEC